MVFSHQPAAVRSGVFAAIKRYFLDLSGKVLLRVYYDFACGLAEYIYKRDLYAAMWILFFHDRYVSIFGFREGKGS